MAEELMVKVEDVYKRDRLGQIGGGTLAGDLQSWWAKVRHKEDPNSKIGAKVYGKNETFYALNGISFEVRKGEALGIIGGNGAGKSTTLKLLSQVTAPTSGKIYLNGRIASMLEVGTGFHPELTGRENIYLNGAILGMTKAEIDSKVEEIIDFSECRQFIDTPVKRYSSGMYVKLAFSVAAHLDSEIMIMDEVLAVGDMAFQKKCIDKMVSISKQEGRTILYVSHNMNTIKQPCNRCIVLEKGKLIFEGDTEQAIAIYLKQNQIEHSLFNDYKNLKRLNHISHNNVAMLTSIEILDKKDCVYEDDEIMKIRVDWDTFDHIDSLSMRLEFKLLDGTPIMTSICNAFMECEKDKHYSEIFKIDISEIVPGRYKVFAVLYEINEAGSAFDYDAAIPAYAFEKSQGEGLFWDSKYYSNIKSVGMVHVGEQYEK